jgi:hypothetical protein
MRRHPETDWLSSDEDKRGAHMDAWLHDDDRYLEIKVCDYDAPKERRWTVTVIDRQFGAKASITGPGAFNARNEAMRQIGMVPPYRTARAA